MVGGVGLGDKRNYHLLCFKNLMLFDLTFKKIYGYDLKRKFLGYIFRFACYVRTYFDH